MLQNGGLERNGLDIIPTHCSREKIARTPTASSGSLFTFSCFTVCAPPLGAPTCLSVTSGNYCIEHMTVVHVSCVCDGVLNARADGPETRSSAIATC